MKESKKVHIDLYYRDSRVSNGDDPLQDYYSTLTPSTHLKLKNQKPAERGFIEIEGHKIPDPKRHQIVSFIKSAIRIGGYIAIPFNLELAAIVLILSEMVGVAEELV